MKWCPILIWKNTLYCQEHGMEKYMKFPMYEDCSGCPHRSKCHKSRFDRIIRLNYELTSFRKEVLDNLNSIHGALLRMNRSIQSEGTYGEIKANRGYERFRRRGINKVILEIALISCGFNLHKYHLSKLAKSNPAKAAVWISSKECRRKTNFLRLWLVYTFLREKLSTALMGKKKQTLSISGKSLRFPFGVI